VPVAVATGRQRIDRIDRIPRLDERRDPQAAVGLDPDHDLTRLNRMLGQQRVQLPDPGQTLRHPPFRQALAVLVEHADLVMGLGPVIPDENHSRSSSRRPTDSSQRRTSAT